MARRIILVLLILGSCGRETPDYTLYGMRVFAHNVTGPVRSELKRLLDTWGVVVGDTFGVGHKRTWAAIKCINFWKDTTWLPSHGREVHGYVHPHPDGASIHVVWDGYGPYVMLHEVVHVWQHEYFDTWDTGHTNRDAWSTVVKTLEILND